MPFCSDGGQNHAHTSLGNVSLRFYFFRVHAEICVLELLGPDTLFHHGSLRRPVCSHWAVPFPPLICPHHAGLLLAAGMLPHLLQLLPEHHLFQVQGGRHCNCRALCLGHDSRVSRTLPSPHPRPCPLPGNPHAASQSMSSLYRCQHMGCCI